MSSPRLHRRPSRILSGALGRAVVSTVVTGALLLAVAPARATPWVAPSSVALTAAPAEGSVEATLEATLESGDLSAAKALAREAREAEPTAAHWQREAEVLERAGEYGPAADAYRSAKAAAGEDPAAVAAADEGLARVQARARGTVADEPASTHRKALDEHWDPPAPEEPEPAPEPEPEPEPREGGKIVTKWYFWLTIGAIVASAAAVTVIAIRAARDEQPDALDSLAPAGPRRPAVLRF